MKYFFKILTSLLVATLLFHCTPSIYGGQKDGGKKPETVRLVSEITCPTCGHKATETMPTEVCQIAYTCKQCGHEMHPEGNDCCVFCSYGDHHCPSKQ